MLKVAYLCEPQVGGTYTTFKLLREPLREHGVEFICICPFDGDAYKGGPFEHEAGVVFLPLGKSIDEDAKTVFAYLQQEQIGVLMVLPESYDLTPVIATRYGDRLKVIIHVDHITRGTYRPTAWLRKYADGVLVVAERHVHDLCRYYKFKRDELRLIWHGVKPRTWIQDRKRDEATILRIGWLGRVEDLQKNVLLLPKIAAELNRRGYRGRYRIDIVGSGPDSCRLAELHRELKLEDSVKMHGTISDDEVNRLIATWDVFIFPSRFEGFGFALAEAMATGCVPVVSYIKGVFDHLVPGDCGYIISSPGVDGYVDALVDLMQNPEKLKSMSEFSQQRIAGHFSVERMAREHAEYFKSIAAAPVRTKPAKVLYRRRTTGDYLRGLVPGRVKKRIRNLAERVGIPV